MKRDGNSGMKANTYQNDNQTINNYNQEKTCGNAKPWKG